MRNRIRIGMQAGAGFGKWKRVLAFFLAVSMTVCAGGTVYAEGDAVILSEETGTETVWPETAVPADEDLDLRETNGTSDIEVVSVETVAKEEMEDTPHGNLEGADPGSEVLEKEDPENTDLSSAEKEILENEDSESTEPSFEGNEVLESENSESTEQESSENEALENEDPESAEPSSMESEVLESENPESIEPSSAETPDDEITYLAESTLKSGDADDGSASRLFMRSTLEYECCYGDQLVGESREIYDMLVDKWGNGGTGDLTYHLKTKLPFDEENVALVSGNAQMAYDAFIYDYPEVFWLQDARMSIGRNSSNLLVSVVLSGNERYTGAKSEVSRFNQAVKSEADIIRDRLPENADRYTIVKTIHDYICETTEYDYLSINYREINGILYYDTSHTAAGVFLKDRVVVCEGYAKAFKILCDQFGIESALIIGSANGENHMWNYVKMDDGRWYLVDATWDDQRDRIYDTYLLAGSMSQGFTRLVWEERQSWTDFSGSRVKNFVLPVLSTYAYEIEEHEWKETSKTAATCRSYATTTYRCTICGITKTEITGPETGHDWGPYKSNNDATWQKDGTKTAKCRYGCGETKTVVDEGTMLPCSIKVNVSALRLKVGQSTSAVKVTLVKGDKVVSWKSDEPTVASVNSKGEITAGMETGKAVITLATRSGLTKKITVTVQKKAVETTDITGLSQKVTLKKGKKLQLAPVIKPVTSLQKVTYVSSNKKIAAVTAKGVITAKKTGTTKITVRSGKKVFKVTVKVKKS